MKKSNWEKAVEEVHGQRQKNKVFKPVKRSRVRKFYVDYGKEDKWKSSCSIECMWI